MTSLKTATFFLIVFAILSKILGILREILIAYFFGTSSQLDALLIGMTIPNNIMHLIVGSTFLVAFIPVFSKSLAKNDEKQAWQFASSIINLCVVIFGAVLVPVSIFASTFLVKLFAPGFSENTYKLAVSLTRIMLPSMLFFSLTTIAQGILNSYEHFTTPGLKATVLNLTMIFVMLVGYKFMGIYSLAFGFLLASISQLLIQVPQLLSKIKNYIVSLNFSEHNFKNFVNLFLPLSIVMGINELNILVDRIIASTLPEGSISALTYSSHLIQATENIFGVSFATVLFPRLTFTSYKGDWTQFESLLSKGLKILFFSTLPITFAFIFFGKPIIMTLFQRGSFNQNSTLITNSALFYYAFAAFFMSANYVLLRALYALEKVKITVVISSVSLILNIILNIILSKIMGIGGITLATSITTGVLFFLAIKTIAKQVEIKDFVQINRRFVVIFLVQFVSFIIGWILYNNLKYSYLINFLISISVTFVVLSVISKVLKIEEYNWILETVVSKLLKVNK